MIHPNSHPTYNERHQNIIEIIDQTLEKYKEVSTATNIKENNQQNEEQEQIIINNIINELDKQKE